MDEQCMTCGLPVSAQDGCTLLCRTTRVVPPDCELVAMLSRDPVTLEVAPSHDLASSPRPHADLPPAPADDDKDDKDDAVFLTRPIKVEVDDSPDVKGLIGGATVDKSSPRSAESEPPVSVYRKSTTFYVFVFFCSFSFLFFTYFILSYLFSFIFMYLFFSYFYLFLIILFLFIFNLF